MPERALDADELLTLLADAWRTASRSNEFPWDADVALHALVDAILGAIADGDIGKHFSPNDPRWRGASSDQFLKFAVDRVNKRGGRIAHLDLTIVCEEPRIGPYRDTIRKRIAEIAEMSRGVMPASASAPRIARTNGSGRNAGLNGS